LLALAALWAVTFGRKRIAPYFMSRDRSREQREQEVWMGGATDGYVPKPELGPSPRERLKSPPDDRV
jgi:hypothetical protein